MSLKRLVLLGGLVLVAACDTPLSSSGGFIPAGDSQACDTQNPDSDSGFSQRIQLCADR